MSQSQRPISSAGSEQPTIRFLKNKKQRQWWAWAQRPISSGGTTGTGKTQFHWFTGPSSPAKKTEPGNELQVPAPIYLYFIYFLLLLLANISMCYNRTFSLLRGYLKNLQFEIYSLIMSWVSVSLAIKLRTRPGPCCSNYMVIMRGLEIFLLMIVLCLD